MEKRDDKDSTLKRFGSQISIVVAVVMLITYNATFVRSSIRDAVDSSTSLLRAELAAHDESIAAHKVAFDKKADEHQDLLRILKSVQDSLGVLMLQVHDIRMREQYKGRP